MNEEWRSVVGYESVYEVSNWGNVARVTTGSDYLRKKYGGEPRRIMVASPSNGGYLLIGLSFLGVRRTFSVHSLVAAAFIGPRPDGFDINHIDAVRHNNRVENLEYVTTQDNIQHSYKLGISKRGENRHGSKLKESDVIEIRRLHSEGALGYRRLSRQFGIDNKTVRNIVNRVKWKHI